jgi:hypothetical protein
MMKLDATYAEQQRKAVAEQLPRIVPAADAARLEGLRVALVAEAAQQSALTIHRARNAAKYGPSSDQVNAVDVRLQTGTQTMQAIQVAQARAQQQAPAVPAGAAGIFGRVVDTTGTGIGKATVVAVDQAGSQAGKATSASDGTYQITLRVRGSKTPQVKTTESASSTRSITVHLEVQLRKKTVLTDDETLTLQAGDVILRELSIAAPTADEKSG